MNVSPRDREPFEIDVPKLNNELTNLLGGVTKFNVEIRVNDKNEVESGTGVVRSPLRQS